MHMSSLKLSRQMMSKAMNLSNLKTSVRPFALTSASMFCHVSCRQNERKSHLAQIADEAMDLRLETLQVGALEERQKSGATRLVLGRLAEDEGMLDCGRQRCRG